MWRYRKSEGEEEERSPESEIHWILHDASQVIGDHNVALKKRFMKDVAKAAGDLLEQIVGNLGIPLGARFMSDRMTSIKFAVDKKDAEARARAAAREREAKGAAKSTLDPDSRPSPMSSKAPTNKQPPPAASTAANPTNKQPPSAASTAANPTLFKPSNTRSPLQSTQAVEVKLQDTEQEKDSAPLQRPELSPTKPKEPWRVLKGGDFDSYTTLFFTLEKPEYGRNQSGQTKHWEMQQGPMNKASSRILDVLQAKKYGRLFDDNHEITWMIEKDHSDKKVFTARDRIVYFDKLLPYVLSLSQRNRNIYGEIVRWSEEEQKQAIDTWWSYCRVRGDGKEIKGVHNAEDKRRAMVMAQFLVAPAEYYECLRRYTPPLPPSLSAPAPEVIVIDD